MTRSERMKTTVMKKILFPTDFSEAAKNAFAYALQLAEAMDGQVDLMHIYHLTSGEAGRLAPNLIEEAIEEHKREALSKMEAFVAPFPPDRIGIMRADYGVFIYQEIIDAAAQLPYDLIVMGTRSKRPTIEKILGGVTTHTMMHATCPVLAVPEEARYRDIQSIVYATDFQPSDQHAVNRLMDFAGALGADVHFVHVDTKAKAGNIENYIVVEDHPFKFTDFFVIGGHSVVQGLDGFIERKGVDLLALFIPQRRLWERLFHTSITKKMTFQVKLPVLVFRE